MSEQTPSTEDVRVLAALNAYYNVRHYGDTRAIAALDDYHPNNVEAMRAAVRAARNPAHDRETEAKVLDDLSVWLTALHEKYPFHADYVPLALLNIERFRSDRMEAGE